MDHRIVVSAYTWRKSTRRSQPLNKRTHPTSNTVPTPWRNSVKSLPKLSDDAIAPRKIIYIHGYNGTPEGPKLDMLRVAYPSAEIYAPQHDSVPDHVFQLFDAVVSTLDLTRDVVIGNSLGGFWANYFSLRYNLPALLINPAIYPSKSLSSVGCSLADAYASYEEEGNTKNENSPRLVLLAEDDRVIPYHEVFNYFSGSCKVILLKRGGHSMNDPASIAVINKCVPRVVDAWMATQNIWL